MSKTLASFITTYQPIVKEFDGKNDYKLIESAFREYFERKPPNDVVWKIHAKITDLPEMSWEELLAL